ncbi:hypothetical protein CTKA_00456 [Chthonomonas calidirosea]|uniref:Uncharacterized protein conserved in bacteria (DUF2252) n=1 Tax=Chthonomonas calidirosea (strain DSM 23976 / ICMP 18418 / T49) TaxID=1303518 RepID=S0ET42_CHTCT|nr:DUF2252 family protein [Chthonomonas calidirosea]CCW34524.1 Uncharacterized protein conserved in bacteria (DUF2252) [Chthonomonas calidirosea T49]CEK14538.1 hypothetical protein CTKA_00456 [Chthonomonas calidirosea]
MRIQRATRLYNEWMALYTVPVESDLQLKYKAMASSAFPFLRATFYRWMQRWPKVCAEFANAPTVLGVGDLHVENFGTWRDAEGRLVWGINDFDEAAHFPYTLDIIRLATSAILAIEENHLHLSADVACTAILEGYLESLAKGGRPYVLAEEHGWLRHLTTGELRNPEKFFHKMDALPEPEGPIPESAQVALEHLLPAKGLSYKLKRRIAGLGSLGRPRYAAIAEWEGGLVVREAKALLPSAAIWAAGLERAPEIYYQALLDRAVRCRDPFVRLEGHWIVRRLAPDCSRIELSQLPQERDEQRLLHAMGFETANVHLGSPNCIADVLPHVKRLKASQLRSAANAMVEATLDDWQKWRQDPFPEKKTTKSH